MHAATRYRRGIMHGRKNQKYTGTQKPTVCVRHGKCLKRMYTHTLTHLYSTYVCIYTCSQALPTRNNARPSENERKRENMNTKFA